MPTATSSRPTPARTGSDDPAQAHAGARHRVRYKGGRRTPEAPRITIPAEVGEARHLADRRHQHVRSAQRLQRSSRFPCTSCWAWKYASGKPANLPHRPPAREDERVAPSGRRPGRRSARTGSGPAPGPRRTAERGREGGRAEVRSDEASRRVRSAHLQLGTAEHRQLLPTHARCAPRTIQVPCPLGSSPAAGDSEELREPIARETSRLRWRRRDRYFVPGSRSGARAAGGRREGGLPAGREERA